MARGGRTGMAGAQELGKTLQLGVGKPPTAKGYPVAVGPLQRRGRLKGKPSSGQLWKRLPRKLQSTPLTLKRA